MIRAVVIPIFLVAMIVGYTVGLVGCGMPPQGAPATLQTAMEKAQAAINEANTLLAAAAVTVEQNTKAGILTRAEAQAYVAKLRELARKVDEAQAALRLGDVTQAGIVNKLVLALHAEIAKRARGAT